MNTLILHHNHHSIQLNLSNDNEWHQISSIQPISSSISSHSSRSLLEEPEGEGAVAPKPGAAGKPMLKVYTGHVNPKTYEEAGADCKGQGGILAAIENSQQNNNVMKECAKFGANVACYIGLKSPFTAWADAKGVVYRNWVPGQPKTDGSDGDCVEIYPDGRWGATDCEKGRSYICQKIEPGLPSAQSGAPVSHSGSVGGTGCHPHYGCGGGCAKEGGGCGGGCGAQSCGRSMCAEPPCAKIRKQEDEHDRRIKRRARRRKRERRMRRKWRERLRRLRKRKDRKLKRALNKLRRRHEREGATYSWIADLLQRKILAMQDTGQIKQNKGKSWRRMMVDDVYHDMNGLIQRCSIVDGVYQVCLRNNVEDISMDLMVRFVEKKMSKEGDVNMSGYRSVVDMVNDWFDEEYRMGHNDDKWLFNPIEGSLGDVINKYDSLWFKDYVHYFDWFVFDFNGVYRECSTDIDYLPFKMCLVVIDDDIVLYFEKDNSDKYDIYETYSFEAKAYIDDQFEGNVFSFKSDNDWDEINVVNNEESVIKCSHKLMIAKVCIQQFDNGQKYKASIRFKARNTKRDKT